MDHLDNDQLSIGKILNQSDSGLTELMDRYERAIFHFVLRMVRLPQDAEEITAETFVKVYQKAAQYRPKAKVKTWIFSIAANLSRDHLRKIKRKPSPVSLYAQRSSNNSEMDWLQILASESRSPGAEMEEKEAIWNLDRAIANLPEKLRTPFVLFVLEEHSQDDCAEILGITRKAVETRVYRARNLLRDLISSGNQTITDPNRPQS